MKFTKKIYFIFFIQVLILIGACESLSAQQILNVTRIPYNVFDYKEPRDIKLKDGKVIVPMYVNTNEVYNYLPDVTADSFPTPEDVFTGLTKDVGGTFYAEYEPTVGFVYKDIVNYNWKENQPLEEEYIGFTGSTCCLGMNNNILLPFPTSEDSLSHRKSLITVYDKTLDSYVYTNIFAENRKLQLTSDIEDDYIYVNIPITWNEQVSNGDLIFMGDTLTYDVLTIWPHVSNYLSKINFKTGEKEWTRNIGYGIVHQIVVDDQHRINIDMETGAPAMYNMEWEDPDFNLEDYGRYDRLIYRMTEDGVLDDFTYIKTFGVPSIYEVEFNRDGSFQAFGLVHAPIFVHVEGDSLDYTDALSFNNSKGLALVFDENLKFKWGKKIISEGRTLVRAVNLNPNGDYLISTVCEGETINIEGEKFFGPSTPEGVQLLDQSVLTRVNNSGDLLGSPVFSNHNIKIEDVQALDEHHYLLNVRKFGFYGYDFLDTTFYGSDVSYFIEYEGDIFDIMTSVESYFAEEEEIKVWPNPVSEGGKVEISLSPSYEQAEIKLYSSLGTLIKAEKTDNLDKIRFQIPQGISAGIYFIKIEGENKFESIPIYID